MPGKTIQPPPENNLSDRNAAPLSFLQQMGRLLDGAIFYGVLSLIALTAVPYGTVDPWSESIFEAAVFGLTILWLVEGSLRGAWWGREHRLLLPLLALVLFAMVQTLPLWTYGGSAALGGARVNRTLSADPFETWRFAHKLLAVALTLGLLLRYASTMHRMRLLIYLVIGIGVASAVFGLVREEMPTSMLGSIGNRLLANGSYGQFENRNHFAFLMEMSIGLVLGLIAADWAHKKRLILYALAAVTLWAALLLTHSRGGALSLVIEIPFFFFLLITMRNVSLSRGSHNGRPNTDRLITRERSAKTSLRSRPWITAVVGGVLLLAAAGVSVIIIGGDETVTRLELTPTEFTARTAGPPKVLRPQIWQATLKLIRENPIAGVGFAGYAVAIPQYLNAAGDWTLEQAHNDYLELLASGGLVGSALGVWFLIVFFTMARQRLRGASSFCRAVRCGSLAGLLALAAHSFFDFGLHITINSLACAILIVLAVKGCGHMQLQQPA